MDETGDRLRRLDIVNLTVPFRDIIESGDVKTLPLPARSPNLNAFSERWVKSVKDDCLSKLILFGEASLRRALHDYLAHYKDVSYCPISLCA